MAKVTDLIFYCLMLLQPDMCLLAYRSTYNAFFMDLYIPVSSFVSQLSLLLSRKVLILQYHRELQNCKNWCDLKKNSASERGSSEHPNPSAMPLT